MKKHDGGGEGDSVMKDGDKKHDRSHRQSVQSTSVRGAAFAGSFNLH